MKQIWSIKNSMIVNHTYPEKHKSIIKKKESYFKIFF